MINKSVVNIEDYCLKNNSRFDHKNADEYKIYTPEIIEKYKKNFKCVLKITKDKTKTQYLMYNKILKWYKNEKHINISMERIYINSKLDSYTTGGCGISASFLAGLASSGIIYYIDNFIQEIPPIFFPIYLITTLCFGIKVLSNEDHKVEMYNMFLEVLKNIEYDNNDSRG